MMLLDCQVGDIVVVDDHGYGLYVLLGALLIRKEKKAVPHGAYADLVDPETLRPVTFSMRWIDPASEVVAIVETGARRRELLVRDYRARMKRATGEDPHRAEGDVELDPMLSVKSGGW